VWRRISVLILVSCFTSTAAVARDVEFGIMGLFRPAEIEIASKTNELLIFELESSKRVKASSVRVLMEEGRMMVTRGNSKWFTTSVKTNGRFRVTIPGKLHRDYSGSLAISVSEDHLQLILTLPLEEAVAAIVKAESGPDMPLEALKAQAVVTRSYVSAGQRRHKTFDFCDTTHCQFFAGPVANPDDLASKATAATRDEVLVYEDRIVQAMFMSSCGGSTLTVADIRPDYIESTYPYYRVQTASCLRHPDRWRRSLPRSLSFAPKPSWGTESFRLAIGRVFGWNALPSNRYKVRTQRSSYMIEGTGHGHGLGLCQRGSRAMAGEGRTYRDILEHYYPNTTVKSMATQDEHREHSQVLQDASPRD